MHGRPFSILTRERQDTGLRLMNMWQCVEEPNNVFFMFEVTSMDRARAFISAPEAAKVGEASGVIDGECYFVKDAGD